jgi:hypothetical protein
MKSPNMLTFFYIFECHFLRLFDQLLDIFQQINSFEQTPRHEAFSIHNNHWSCVVSCL